ncbi:hypothetical protein ED733_001114 [Metarhizium rileyi]|uniref:Enoyl reductase (ER) domain-containing protein n=1 Tax=Metarhizium rileyi (strain RCEF 4871) TaxID=1649241 RepID=A0A5C6GDB2_METRR|nr:hypothetical protein ED733_001114 [Metarhizium rileyi]
MKRCQSALIGTADGMIRLSPEVGIAPATGDVVVVRTKAVSVSPVDAKMQGPYITAGAIAGCDFAGVVQEIAPDVGSSIKPGDRVCGTVLGMNPLRPLFGAFAEYTAAPERALLKLPSSWTFAQGASVGISFLTTGLALFKSLALPGDPFRPNEQALPVLIFGGSSSTGTAAIQLVKLAGFDPITTCSPPNFDLVKSYGASAAFDYRAPDCVVDIKRHTNNALVFVLDCISTAESMSFCYKVIGRAGGKYTALEAYSEDIAKSRRVITPDWVMGPQLLGEEIAWPMPHARPANKAMAKFGVEWMATLQKLLDNGLIRPHPLLTREGNLSHVLNGIEEVRLKKISGKKLVYVF